MRFFNIIYIIAILLGFLLYSLYVKVKSDAAFFYGFAENKETEINHNRDILIKKIHVTPGQKVKKGELLLTASNAILPSKISELELEKKVVVANISQDMNQIKYKLSELKIEKSNKLQETQAKINELNKEIELRKSLYEGLKSIKNPRKSLVTTKEVELNYLVQKLNTISNTYNQEIANHEELLENIQHPSKIKNRILDNKIAHYKELENQLSIYAPSDGIVGSIHCKEQENITAFRSLLDFYQVNPTLVKGFVHESLLLQVKVGNKLSITSSMHNEHNLIGTVIGLGTRIVEIPERLRKIADIKTYGREVLIEISPDNKFLQKEKVMVNTIIENNKSFLTALLPQS